MAEEKYISKVRISGENFVIRDKDSYALAQKAEESIKAMANLSPTELSRIQSDLTLIKQELSGTPVNEWTTLVDKLAYLGNDTVKTYVDNAVAGAKTAAASDATSKDNQVKIDLIGTSTDVTTANTIWGAKNYAVKTLTGSEGDGATYATIWGAKSYADEKKAEAIKEAATASGNLATNALNEAKRYADTKKSEAIGVAASDATSKANTAKNEAISAAASDATSKANTAKNEAIKAAASDATSKDNQVKIDLIGKYTDSITTDTIWGAKNYAVKTLTGSTGDTSTYATIWGAKKYADEKIETLSNTAFKVRRIEEGNEGILVFSTVSSYAG